MPKKEAWAHQNLIAYNSSSSLLAFDETSSFTLIAKAKNYF